MVSKKEIDKFIKLQRTFTAKGPEYKKTQKALRDVLSAIPNEDFKQVTDNLILTVLHRSALGQVMHFPPRKKKFEIVQLTVPKDMPIYVLRWVIAHEFGHVMQGRNWKRGDGETLEEDANRRAVEWGFTKNKKIKDWMKKDKLR